MIFPTEFQAACDAASPEKRAEIDDLRSQIEALESQIEQADRIFLGSMLLVTPSDYLNVLRTGKLKPNKPKYGRGGRRNRKRRRALRKQV